MQRRSFLASLFAAPAAVFAGLKAKIAPRPAATWQVTEVAKLFRIPPHMVYTLERSTYSNTGQLQDDFIRANPALRRYLVNNNGASPQAMHEPRMSSDTANYRPPEMLRAPQGQVESPGLTERYTVRTRLRRGLATGTARGAQA